jgi:hypothetical protein
MRDEWFEDLMAAYETILQEHHDLARILLFNTPLTGGSPAFSRRVAAACGPGEPTRNGESFSVGSAVRRSPGERYQLRRIRIDYAIEFLWHRESQELRSAEPDASHSAADALDIVEIDDRDAAGIAAHYAVPQPVFRSMLEEGVWMQRKGQRHLDGGAHESKERLIGSPYTQTPELITSVHVSLEEVEHF